MLMVERVVLPYDSHDIFAPGLNLFIQSFQIASACVLPTHQPNCFHSTRCEQRSISCHALHLPVLLLNRDFIHIHSVFEPSLLIGDLDIVSTHLSLPHAAIFREGPIFKTISPPPVYRSVLNLCKKEETAVQTRTS